MASVTLVLGQPTAVNTAWIQWDVRDQPENLGDVTVLSEDPANSPTVPDAATPLPQREQRGCPAPAC